MYYKTIYKSPIGNLSLASDGQFLVGLWIENQKHFQSSISGNIIKNDNLEIFNKTKLWLDKYFNKEQPKINNIPLLPSGNDFRREVWDILLEIPYGKVTTYGDIAEKIAKRKGIQKMSARAIGGAVGHNPISIIIPCHRVIGKNGNLTGYAGGIETKIKLLTHEKVDFNNLFTGY